MKPRRPPIENQQVDMSRTYPDRAARPRHDQTGRGRELGAAGPAVRQNLLSGKGPPWSQYPPDGVASLLQIHLQPK